jgi:hypothetical protein
LWRGLSFLDFASAYLDRRPDFSEEAWAEWASQKREQFDVRWPVVQRVLAALEEFGIYMLDVSPGNIAFADCPALARAEARPPGFDLEL